MTKSNFSRRRFLQGVTAGSAGAALVSLPEALGASEAAPSPGPPSPVIVESYPIAQPGKGTAARTIKIVTLADLSPAYQQRIRALSADRRIELKTCASEDEFHREVADAHVIYGRFSRSDLAAAKELKWIQHSATGVENILSPELVDGPVVLTNMQRMFAPTISESVFALLLSLTRGLNRYAVQTGERQWRVVPGLVEITGMTMGLVGLGGIGTATAYRAHYGFDMKVLAVDPKPLPKPAFVAELHSLDWLPEMVPQVDVLASVAPHTRLSEGMFSESIFRAMKRTAYFINVSRGKLVDTPALVRALKEGWIAGAGLDVAYREPLPPDEPLWSAGNVIISCHSSGQSQNTPGRLLDLFAENVRRYIGGLPLLNVVDKKRGY